MRPCIRPTPPTRGRPGIARLGLLCLAALGLGGGALTAAAAESSRTVQGQDVIVIQGEQRTVYEYRQNGVLRMIRVVPDRGKPYYLVPADETRGYGNLEEADMLLPRWILIEF